MTYEMIVSLQIFALVSTCTPGPNNIMLMVSGLNYGYVKSLPHMLGVGLGVALLAFFVGMGLFSLFEMVPFSFIVLKILCAAYLLYLAWKIATAQPSSLAAMEDKKGSKPFSFWQALLFQWLNPKAWSMVVSALTLYTPSEKSFETILIVCVCLLVAAIPSTNMWTVLGAQLSRVLGNDKNFQRFNFVCAVLLVGSLYPIVFK